MCRRVVRTHPAAGLEFSGPQVTKMSSMSSFKLQGSLHGRKDASHVSSTSGRRELPSYRNVHSIPLPASRLAAGHEKLIHVTWAHSLRPHSARGLPRVQFLRQAPSSWHHNRNPTGYASVANKLHNCTLSKEKPLTHRVRSCRLFQSWHVPGWPATFHSIHSFITSDAMVGQHSLEVLHALGQMSTKQWPRRAMMVSRWHIYYVRSAADAVGG
jgi:hypothetical protein